MINHDRAATSVCKYVETRDYTFNSPNFYSKCYHLQINCAWDDPFAVTLNEFTYFTDLYPQYKVVIYSNKFSTPFITQGLLFESKVIYIYHDLDARHYVYITAIKTFGCKFIGSGSFKFCVDCSWWYAANRKGNRGTCRCEEPNTGTDKRVYIQCENCGKRFEEGGKHDCSAIPCHFCPTTYVHDEVKNHRCPIYPKPQPKNYWKSTRTQTSKNKNRLPKLWFYDIESHFINTEETVKEYEVDSDGTIPPNPRRFHTRQIYRKATVRPTPKLLVRNQRIHKRTS